MFFRRKAKPAGPIKGEDGHYYVDDEGEYDSDEWETDSDYSSENESDEENKQDLEEDDGSEVKTSDAAAESEEDKDVASEQDEGVNDDGEENTNEIVVNEDTQDNCEETTRDTKEAENTESMLDSTNGHALDLEEVNLSTDSAGMVSVNIDEETTEDQFEASKKEVEESPTQDASNNEENNLTMTLEEKRSLVALAAEHDRVDILKTILQPHPAQRTDGSNPIFLAQLLLNNIIVKDPSNSYTEEDLEKVFIPPLHVAIASSATNAATCLLRMGSDPSIRPNIPESDEWEGPSWQDENGELYAERGGIGAASSWKLFHGVSAWELAFGTLQIPTSNEKDDVKSKSKWFGFRSKTSPNNQEEVEEKKLYIPIEVEENKLEGIKHAFTAEALRAIGSDEVTRLSELINSGLGTTSRIEIGGKDLFAWCQEMNAQNCIAMLESMNASTDPEAEYYEANDDSDGESESFEEVEAEDETAIVEEQTTKIESTMGSSDDESTTEYDEARLEEMTNKLEESEALSSALSTMLDHIAEEVAITEGLIMQQGDSSNTTLLSQVRVLKTKRAELEDELSRQQRILEDRYAELDMVKIWWKKQGGSLREIPTRMEEYKKQKEEDAKKAKMTGNFKEDIKKVTQKLEESEKRVRKIRSSIAELSQVSVKNLKEVEKLGLLGEFLFSIFFLYNDDETLFNTIDNIIRCCESHSKAKGRSKS